MKKMLTLGTILLLSITVSLWSRPKKQIASTMKPFSMLLTSTNGQPTQRELGMEVDVQMRNRHTDMKTQFQDSLEKFKKSYDFGEVLIQQLVNLLDLELMIVHCLLSGHTGAMVEKAIWARDQALSQSVPSVAFMYDKIVDLASYDHASNKKIFAYYSAHSRHLTHALNWTDKKEFLKNMYGKLEHYSGLMRAMQCDFAIGTSTAESNVRVGRYGRSLSFCPVVH